jgi:hypothetical protein
MDLQHVNVKIYVEGDLTVDCERFIEVFHRWIQEPRLEELLIDVADYRHVPAGPGVVLIGHEADYAMDNAGNRFGLLYNRKAELDGSNEDRLGQAFRAAANACQMLEAEFEEDGPLKFSRQEFEIIINDRALASNTPETFQACNDDLKSFFTNLLGHTEFTLEQHADPRSRFGVTVTVAKPFELSEISKAGS